MGFRGQIKPKRSLTLHQIWDSLGLSTPDFADLAAAGKTAETNDLFRILAPWLDDAATGYLPPAVLREITNRGCENGTVFTVGDTFVLPTPIRLDQILVTHLPTIRSIFPNSE